MFFWPKVLYSRAEMLEKQVIYQKTRNFPLIFSVASKKHPNKRPPNKPKASDKLGSGRNFKINSFIDRNSEQIQTLLSSF